MGRAAKLIVPNRMFRFILSSYLRNGMATIASLLRTSQREGLTPFPRVENPLFPNATARRMLAARTIPAICYHGHNDSSLSSQPMTCATHFYVVGHTPDGRISPLTAVFSLHRSY